MTNQNYMHQLLSSFVTETQVLKVFMSLFTGGNIIV